MSTYELKFLIDRDSAGLVECWARDNLAIDPHADPSLDGAYRVRSLYCDTAGLDVYLRNDGYRRRKFRLRRYGCETVVHLERKSKPGDRVKKRRSAIPGSELAWLNGTGAADPAWPGFWFQRRLLSRGLQPRCLISYDRHAHVGMSADGPLRLTLDHRIRAAPSAGYSFESASPEAALMPDAVILELKYQSSLPALFKRLIHDMTLAPANVSKYRAGIEACGLAANSKAAVPRAEKAG